MITVVDAGTGNLRSLVNALSELGFESRVEPTPPEDPPDAVVLPGVGAFGHAAAKLQELGWRDFLLDAAGRGVPLLGICLGMQLLFEASEESPGAPGLGILQGSVRKLDASLAKVPHVGWAPLRFTSHGCATREPLWAYFVHSYVARPSDPSVVAAWARHGTDFPAVVRKGPVTGVQFHPERSQRGGLECLKNLLGGAP